MTTRNRNFSGSRVKKSGDITALTYPVKTYILLLLAMISVAGSVALPPIPTSKIEIYYFHYTKRSQASLNAENVSREAVLALYPVKIKRAEMFFKSVNLDDKDGAALAAKFKIKKEAFVVILLDKKEDLTKKAIKYAEKQPEKLREEIKKAVESVIKQVRGS